MSEEDEEALREAACVGNIQEIEKLLKTGVDVKSSNKVNGWTALHWSCKRGHVNVVERLLRAGSDKEAKNTKGEVPADLTRNNQIRQLLGAPLMDGDDGQTAPPAAKHIFTPSYLANPVFPYTAPKGGDSSVKYSAGNIQSPGFFFQPQQLIRTKGDIWCPSGYLIHPDFIVLRLRVASSATPGSEFTEIEIDRREAPTLEELINICCEHLGLDTRHDDVKKLRKLPNVVLRNDRDVLRLTDYQSMELVLNPHSLHLKSATLSQSAAEHPEARYMRDQVSKFVY